MNAVDEQTRPGVGNEEYRIPKVAVPVRLCLDGGHEVEGSLYLLPVAGTHVGRERVVDLLACPDNQFVPLCGPDRVRLIHQTRIVIAWIYEAEDGDTAPVEMAAPELAGEALEIPVELELAGVPKKARRLSGRIHLVMPPGQQRVIDFLNRSEPFFTLETDDGIALVNKRYLLDLWQS